MKNPAKILIEREPLTSVDEVATKRGVTNQEIATQTVTIAKTRAPIIRKTTLNPRLPTLKQLQARHRDTGREAAVEVKARRRVEETTAQADLAAAIVRRCPRINYYLIINNRLENSGWLTCEALVNNNDLNSIGEKTLAGLKGSNVRPGFSNWHDPSDQHRYWSST